MQSPKVAPIVLFPDIRCTEKTYIIHVALNPDKDTKPLNIIDPGYIGSITRLGMGPNNGNNRCITGSSIVRRLDATKAMVDIGDGKIKEGEEVPLKVQVLEVDGQGGERDIPESEYKDWVGFKPVVVWAKPTAGIVA